MELKQLLESIDKCEYYYSRMNYLIKYFHGKFDVSMLDETVSYIASVN